MRSGSIKGLGIFLMMVGALMIILGGVVLYAYFQNTILPTQKTGWYVIQLDATNLPSLVIVTTVLGFAALLIGGFLYVGGEVVEEITILRLEQKAIQHLMYKEEVSSLGKAND